MTADSQPAVHASGGRVRWRVIAAWFLQGFGGLMLLIGALAFCTCLFLLFRHGRDAFGVLSQDMMAIGLFTVAALFVIASGRLLKNKRWGWMALTLLLAYAASASSSLLLRSVEERRRANSIAPIVPDSLRDSQPPQPADNAN